MEENLIQAILSSPAMRSGPVPHFEPRDELYGGERVKRVRQWTGGKDGKILPWIGLNPSGFNKSGRGLSGSTMARLAYRWGFDGVATYNIVPFEGSNPKRDIWPLLRAGGQDLDERIQDFHQKISADLKDVDALVVGWGSKSGPFGVEIVRLARQLVAQINSHSARAGVPVGLWHVGLNEDGAPKHAGARGKFRIPDDARPMEFVFRS